MITFIGLTNFKCFTRLELPLAPLTLLCGLNGTGKSSVMQALLVLRQSYQSGALLEGRLVLSGELADIGAGSDILSESAETDALGFELKWDDRPDWRIDFAYERAADRLEAQKIREHRPPSFVPMTARPAPPFGGEFAYVNAERVGPRKLQAHSEARVRARDLGARGEYSLSFLHAEAHSPISEGDRRLQPDASNRLGEQFDAWLQIVTPGAHLSIEPIAAADAVLGGFMFDRAGDVPSGRFRATNVGFGLSYVLPVILSLLAARPGSVILIENPEAHLHPRGQTVLGELAARAARAGVQVLVETHSDHFMDGARIAVRGGLIDPEQVAFHYFRRNGVESTVESPTLDRDGRLSKWPDGFFDQHDENLSRLLAPRA